MNISRRLFEPQIITFFHLHYYPLKYFQRHSSYSKSDIKKWCKTLGIAEDSDQEAVRLAYIEKVKRYHPDSKSIDADANKFQEIESAYKNLQEKFVRERYNKDACEGEYGLYHQEKAQEKDIDHTAPQHRQYLSYDGVGSGTPSERQRQYTQIRANKAMENVTSYRINKLKSYDNNALTVKDNQKKAKDIKTRFGIERLVEDLIQQSMSKGEFDNLKGRGKPLKNLQKTHNPYVDFVTHKMNEVLIDNGFTPAWINLLKEITEEKNKIKQELLKAREKLGHQPLSHKDEQVWEEVKNKLRKNVKILNGKIDFYNLVVPLLNKQQFQFNLEKEANEALKTGKSHEENTGS